MRRRNEQWIRNVSAGLFGLLLLFGAASTANAQDELAGHPGYVDLTSFDDAIDRSPTFEVNVRGVLMEMAAEAARESKPKLAGLLENLVAVQVRGFEDLDDAADVFARHARALAQDLEREGWQSVVRVREDDEQVDIFSRERNGGIAGLIVMVSGDDDEQVFVNVVGDIRPEQLSMLGEAFDIDPLQEME